MESHRGRHGRPATLIDIDDFKDINDAFGHQEGDRILAAVSGMLAHGVADDAFRQDLYDRRKVVELLVPHGTV